MNMTPSQREKLSTAWSQRPLSEDVASSVWNWPLQEGDALAWGACITAGVVIAGVAWTTTDVVITTVTALSLAIALWRSYVPVRWEIGLSGITQVVLGFKKRIPWIAIAQYEPHEDGVWLYADRTCSPLRGVFISYSGHREAILARIEYYLGTWTSRGDTTTAALPDQLPAPRS